MGGTSEWNWALTGSTGGATPSRSQLCQQPHTQTPGGSAQNMFCTPAVECSGVNEWMNEWMNEWVSERTNERTNEQTKKQTYKQTNKQTNKQTKNEYAKMQTPLGCANQHRKVLDDKTLIRSVHFQCTVAQLMRWETYGYRIFFTHTTHGFTTSYSTHAKKKIIFM